MGIILSIPRFEGPVLSVSSTSYAFDPAQSTAFGISPSISSGHNTEGTIFSGIPAVQTSGDPPPDVTDILIIKSPDYTETTTVYLSTATVSTKIQVTTLTTATATVVASQCPPTTVSSTIQSVPSTRVYTTNAGEVPARSNLPAVSFYYGVSLFSGLSENQADIARTSISTLSSLSVAMSSRYNRSIHNELPGSGPGSSHSSFPTPVTISKNMHSTSRMRPSTSSRLTTDVSNKIASGLLPTSKTVTTRPTGSTRIASGSHSKRSSIAVRGCYEARWGSHCPSDPPVEITYFERLTGTQKHSTVPGPTTLGSTRTLTHKTDITTTTIFTTVTTKHTSTTTVTKFPTSCPTSRTSISRPASSQSCTSATPNPNPPANGICAEDGLLEYNNTPQSPDTLEGCATACLADTTCLSFTFIPSQSSCYTSLYPLADSAFAGTQDYHIYNYDRGCYSCSSS